MATQIDLKKLDEDDDGVIYAFGQPGEIVGTARLDKASGKVELLELESGRDEDFYLPRVRLVLEDHHRHGEFPSTTTYTA